MDTDGNPQNVNNDGADPAANTNLGWRTELPESQRGHEAFASYETKKAFHEGHIALHTANKDLTQKLSDAEGKLGNMIPKLSENATPEEKNAFYAALGRPDSPDKYEIGKSADWPEGVAYSQELENAYRQKAFELGLPAGQTKEIFNWFNTLSNQAFVTERNQSLETIKKEWGSAFEENGAKVLKVKEALVAQMPEALRGEMKAWLDSQNHPFYAYWLLQAAPAFLPDSVAKGGGGSTDTRDIDQQARDFYKNPGSTNTT